MGPHRSTARTGARSSRASAGRLRAHAFLAFIFRRHDATALSRHSLRPLTPVHEPRLEAASQAPYQCADPLAARRVECRSESLHRCGVGPRLGLVPPAPLKRPPHALALEASPGICLGTLHIVSLTIC